MSESAAAGQDASSREAASSVPTGPLRPALLVGVLGVVYGDIGTSPIYALRECFGAHSSVALNNANVLGVLSLIFWSLIVVISLKYMIFVLQADNRGEGGIFALLALLRPKSELTRGRRMLLLFGLFGAALLYGGVMITPAISVLSAVEGLEVAAPLLEKYVVPITIAILAGLFLVQRFGTARVGSIFGPLMVVWFLVLGMLGATAIADEPRVLLAVFPWYAIAFFIHNGWAGLVVLFAVFLVATGGEALYADLGHFGKRPVRIVWFGAVLPALVLNYFGQGAHLLNNLEASLHPFFHLAPDWALYPLVFLATLATMIASQAVITGAFSLTRQAVLLGHVPPLKIRQTAADALGQIYMPAVNWALMLAAIALVMVFRSSEGLAAAYGIAVNGTMAVTTVLAFFVARERGGWSLLAAGLFLAVFLTVDLGFLASNALRIPDGGWLPLVVGMILFVLMFVWKRGSTGVARHLDDSATSLESFIGKVSDDMPVRVPGIAVFLVRQTDQVPAELLHHLRLSKALHEQVVILRIVIERIPKVEFEQRISVEKLEQGFYRLELHYGFMQGVNVPSDLVECADKGLKVDLDEVTYYAGEHTLIVGRKDNGMGRLPGHLFAFMDRNTQKSIADYQIPSDRIVEQRLQISI